MFSLVLPSLFQSAKLSISLWRRPDIPVNLLRVGPCDVFLGNSHFLSPWGHPKTLSLESTQLRLALTWGGTPTAVRLCKIRLISLMSCFLMVQSEPSHQHLEDANEAFAMHAGGPEFYNMIIPLSWVGETVHVTCKLSLSDWCHRPWSWRQSSIDNPYLYWHTACLSREFCVPPAALISSLCLRTATSKILMLKISLTGGTEKNLPFKFPEQHQYLSSWLYVYTEIPHETRIQVPMHDKSWQTWGV